jgi:hypothetical protein
MKRMNAVIIIMVQFLVFPHTALGLGGLDDQKSTQMLVAFLLFSTIGAFVAAGARAGAIMLLVFGILFVVFGIKDGGLPIAFTGIPLDLAIGVVSSIIAAIILAAIKRD